MALSELYCEMGYIDAAVDVLGGLQEPDTLLQTLSAASAIEMLDRRSRLLLKLGQQVFCFLLLSLTLPLCEMHVQTHPKTNCRKIPCGH